MAQQNTYGVETRHKDYQKNIEKWNLVDDVLDSDVIKYLRDVGSSEIEPEDQVKRQKEYADGAVINNFTLGTTVGMRGDIFMKPATIELPSQIEYMENDVDGNGLTLKQQAQQGTFYCISNGRHGLFVDVPSAGDSSPSKLDQESGKMGPRIQMYKAQDITNWGTVRIGSKTVLNMITLMETYEAENASTTIFGTDVYVQYRVLAIDKDGFYYQEVHKNANDSTDSSVKNFQPEDRVYPVQNGSKMDHIPFFFVGSQNNDYAIDISPMYDIAKLNIGQFRNSADTEEGAHVASQPMLVIRPDPQIMTVSELNKENPNGIKVGSRRGVVVPDAKFIQAEASDKSFVLMKDKEEQAGQRGARLATPSARITEESARIQRGATTAVTTNISNNESQGYTDALIECALYAGANPEEVVFKLNTDFFFTTLTAQDRAQWLSEISMGVSPKTLYYMKLRQAGDYPHEWTDEMIDAELERSGMSGQQGIITAEEAAEPEIQMVNGEPVHVGNQDEVATTQE